MQLLENHDYLTFGQWEIVCNSLDKIVEKISETIEKHVKHPHYQISQIEPHNKVVFYLVN